MIYTQIILSIFIILLAIWVFCRPRIGVISLFLFLIFLIKGSQGLTAIELAYSLLFIVTLYGFLSKRLVLGSFNLPNSYLIVAIILFIFYCLVSIIIPLFENIPLLHWLKQWDKFALLLLIFPIITEFKKEKHLRLLLGVFILTGIIVALCGIYSAVSRGKIVVYEKIGIISTVYIWTTILLIGLIGYVKKRTEFFLIAGLLLIGLLRSVISVSRSDLGSILVGTFIILWVTFLDKKTSKQVKLRFVKMVLLGTLVLSLIFPGFIFSVINSYSNRLTSKYLERSLTRRTLVIKAALKDWRSNPLIGQGFGYNFSRPFPIRHPIAGEKDIRKVHNIYVYIFSHAGLIGLGLYLFVLFGIFSEGRACLRQISNSFDRGVVVGLFGAFIAFLAFGLFSVQSMRLETQAFLALTGGVFILFNRYYYKQSPG